MGNAVLCSINLDKEEKITRLGDGTIEIQCQQSVRLWCYVIFCVTTPNLVLSHCPLSLCVQVLRVLFMSYMCLVLVIMSLSHIFGSVVGVVACFSAL